MTTILSGHQPCYLPSLQLFAKMARSDVFMHCGHLQFKQGSWHNRNYILLNGKRHRLTIPIERPHIRPIQDVWFSDQTWKEKHLKTIALAYGDAPYFDDYFPTLKKIIYSNPHSLARLNIRLTDWIADCLDIKIQRLESSSWHFEGDAVDKIIQMCAAAEADTYLSNEGAEDYISPTEEARMNSAGIRHTWLDFSDPKEEPLSTLHHLFMEGPLAGRFLTNALV